MSWLTSSNRARVATLDSGQFQSWLKKYQYELKDEIPQLEAMCRHIQAFSHSQLRRIVKWKLFFDKRRLTRALNLFDATEDDSSIRRKTKILFDDELGSEEKVHLIGGHGGGRTCQSCRSTKIASVGIPVASTVLRFIEPSKYGIIDQYAMDALLELGFEGVCTKKQWGGQPPQYRFEPIDYADYNELITCIAEKVCMTPSQVDMALWSYRKA